MTARARAKKDDVARAVAGAVAGGMAVGKVVVEPNGNIVILSEAAAAAAVRNPWDELLKT
ncbi:MAG: hypothetical protein JO290_02845 [Sphingomonadaceae bacterium]|nr:hypothetical protein [Sphingomonadaceae bacterium]